MKKILLLLIAAPVFAAGPKYKHQDPKIDDEIRNIYHDIRTDLSGTIPSIKVSTATITNLVGSTDGTSAAAGNVGEYREATASLTSFPTTAQYGDLVTLSLTAGDWNISVTCDYDRNGATASVWGCGVWTAAGNDSSEQITGNNWLWHPDESSSVGVSIPLVRAKPTETTTYRLKMAAIYSAGTPRIRGALKARRAR